MRTKRQQYTELIASICDGDTYTSWGRELIDMSSLVEAWYYINSPAGDEDFDNPFYYDISNWQTPGKKAGG